MKPTPTTSFESFGRAALLPGMVHMLEFIEQYVNDFRDELENIQRSGAPPPQPGEVPLKGKRGRPPKTPLGLIPTAGLKRGTPEYRVVDAANKRLRTAAKAGVNHAYGWGGMTPGERSAEMKRRQALAKLNRMREKRSQAAKSRWAHKTRAQQKAQVAALQAGKLKAQQHVNGAA